MQFHQIKSLQSFCHPATALAPVYCKFAPAKMGNLLSSASSSSRESPMDELMRTEKTRRCKISCIKKLGGARSLLHFSHVCTVDFLAAKASVYRPGFDLTVPQRNWAGQPKKDISNAMFWKTEERWQKNKGSWSKIYVLF